MRLLLTVLAVLVTASCQHSAPPASAGPDPAADLPQIQVEPVRVWRERSYDGVVRAVQRATLAAQTAGRVVELPFDVNDFVERGAVVVRFTDVEQSSERRRAEAALRAAQAQAAEAEAEQRRVADLAARRLVPASQLDQATARRDAARAALQAAEAALKQAREQADYTVVRAPYAGVVTARHVEIGETVAPGQPLISGLSLERLRVEVQVPQRDVEAIRSQKRATVVLPDGRTVPAAEVVVTPAANGQVPTFTVRIELPTLEQGPLPGSAVTVRFPVEEVVELRIPQRAVVQRSEASLVYVLADGGRGSLRAVRLGQRDGESVEVLAGLTSGDRIVLEPARLFDQRLTGTPGTP